MSKPDPALMAITIALLAGAIWLAMEYQYDAARFAALAALGTFIGAHLGGSFLTRVGLSIASVAGIFYALNQAGVVTA